MTNNLESFKGFVKQEISCQNRGLTKLQRVMALGCMSKLGSDTYLVVYYLVLKIVLKIFILFLISFN